MTQLDLANESGVPASRISLIECGHVFPSDRDLERLAYAMGLEKEQITGDLPDPNPREVAESCGV
jgi:transcriptional regulator with XRE-family HTH domain